MRLDRISADMVQLLLEGDNIIEAIGRAFNGPSNQEGPLISSLPVERRLPYRQLYNNIFPIEQGSNTMIITTLLGDHHPPLKIQTWRMISIN